MPAMMAVCRCSASERLSCNVVACSGVGQVVCQFNNCNGELQQSVFKVVICFRRGCRFGIRLIDPKRFRFGVGRSVFRVRIFHFARLLVGPWTLGLGRWALKSRNVWAAICAF